MQRCLAFLIGAIACLLLKSCGDQDPKLEFKDPRDGNTYRILRVGGVWWMADDLQYEDSTHFSYQQALSLCPPGWSLPSDEDWRILAENYGGYEEFGKVTGSPSDAYRRMTRSDFNAPQQGYYWTSTPAWLDAADLRSYTVGFTEEQGVSKSAIIITAKIACRCILKKMDETSDYISFDLNGENLRFDYSPFVTPREYYDLVNSTFTDPIAVMMHRQSNHDINLDRVGLFFILPGSPMAEGDEPFVTQGSLSRQAMSDKTWQYNHIWFATDQNFRINITTYNGLVLEGNFSGTTNGNTVTNGSFRFHTRHGFYNKLGL